MKVGGGGPDRRVFSRAPVFRSWIEMEVGEILEVGSKYISGYFNDVLDILSHPQTRFQTPQEFSKGLWIFALLSILLGLALSQFTTLPKSDDYAATTFVILINWIALCVWAHALSRWLLRGSASLKSTIVVGVQVLSITYVISQLAVLLLGVFLKPLETQPDAGLVYVAVQTVMLGVYMTIALHALNRLSRVKTAILAVLVPLPIIAFNLLNLVIYMVSDLNFAK